jgi:uncharacterized Zn finger protein
MNLTDRQDEIVPLCESETKKTGSYVRLITLLVSELRYEPPWTRISWPLPDSGLDVPESKRRDRFPMVTGLVEIAMLEKEPKRVLYWYDRLPKNPSGWYGVNDDEIATAGQTHAPDRAVAIWKSKAERLIDQVKPKAYQEAGKYLPKAAKVMVEENNKWNGIRICSA